MTCCSLKGVLFARSSYAAFILLLAMCFGSTNAPCQIEAQRSSDVIRQMSRSAEELVKRVSPAVVEVLVSGYGSPDEEDEHASRGVGRERSLGSGVIVDPDGYIVTNYHVVKGSDRVRVALTPPAAQESQPAALLKSRSRILPAQIVGFSKLIDIAVLKVEAKGLPTLPIGRYERLQKGQIVLAFGSPEGLENSVTLGLVSSVLRQPDPDDPMVYIQTDAAINPGNSGGPLVDADGNVVGIDTFILSTSGGSEGVGFAIPSGIVRYAYEQIRRYGRVRRRTIGADLQSLTHDLAQGLGLSDDVGVIVSDVFPISPAEHAGLRIQDVIVAVDGMPVDNVPLFALSLYLRNTGNSVKLQILRGNKRLELDVPVFEPRDDPQRLADLGDPKKNLIPGLGIVGVTITPAITESFGQLRIPSGVLVSSVVANRLAVDSGLSEGDVVHSLNRSQIYSVESLRTAFNALQPGDPATMQVERNGRLTYVTFEME
jgi:serine protease Do